jgi:hypothetical protein
MKVKARRRRARIGAAGEGTSLAGGLNGAAKLGGSGHARKEAATDIATSGVSLPVFTTSQESPVEVDSVSMKNDMWVGGKWQASMT